MAAQRRADETRGEQVQEVEFSLLGLHADLNIRHKLKLLEKRGRAHYSTAAVSLISVIHQEKADVQIVNTFNDGALLVYPQTASWSWPV